MGQGAEEVEQKSARAKIVQDFLGKAKELVLDVVGQREVQGKR